MGYKDFPKSPAEKRMALSMPSKKVILPPPAPPLDPLTQAIKDGPQYTILGDTGHEDQSLRDFLMSPELISILKAAGVKHIFLENGSPTNFSYNKLASASEIERQQAMKEAEARKPGLTDTPGFKKEVKFLEEARNSEIKVHYPDHAGPIDPEIRIDPVYRCYQDSVFKRMLTSSDVLYPIKMRERLAQDGLVAERIKNVAGTEKSVVIWGVAHTASSNGLDEALGRKSANAQVIYTMSNATEMMLPATLRNNSQQHNYALQEPNFYYNFQNKNLSQSFPGMENAVEQSKSHEGKWQGFFCKPPL